MSSSIEMILAQSSEALLESARFHERLGYVLMVAALLLLILGVILTIRRGGKKSSVQSESDDNFAPFNREESTKGNS